MELVLSLHLYAESEMELRSHYALARGVILLATANHLVGVPLPEFIYSVSWRAVTSMGCTGSTIILPQTPSTLETTDIP